MKTTLTPWLKLLPLLTLLLATASALAAAPTITHILPPTGSTAGGTAVTIVGTGFTGATGVTIGGVAATAVTVITDSMLNATTAAHAAGTVDVAVTSPGGTGTGTGLYTYGTALSAAGATWTARDSSRSWTSVASSADGSKLVAVVNSGQIYTSVGVAPAPPAPVLGIQRGSGNTTLNWAVPVAFFNLESTATLHLPASWVRVLDLPTVTNGTNYLTVPASGLQFYRLKTP